MRILFKIEDKLKNFYWFEMKSKNLYWGASRNVTFKNNTDIEIDSKNFVDLFPNLKAETTSSRMKFSYHESDQMHLKTEANVELNDSKSNWIKCDEIKTPRLFFFIITKNLSLYDDFKKSLRKKGGSNVIIKIPPVHYTNRLCIEFFISPKGFDQLPKFHLDMYGEFKKPEPLIASLNETFNLMIQLIAVKGEGIVNLKDNSEMFFIVDKLI
jgi:hypothetical protein